MEMSPHWEPSSVEVKISFLISERRIHCKLRTLVTWLKLGEFLLFSVGASSESGRGIELPVLIGDVEGVPFWMRRGWTCSVSAILNRVRCSKFVYQQRAIPRHCGSLPAAKAMPSFKYVGWYQYDPWQSETRMCCP
jgi:hypothetical protein